MKRKRIVAAAALVMVVTGAVWLTLLSFGILAPAVEIEPVPLGHREIIFLAPATSGESWERLVAAVDALHQESLQAGSGKTPLHVDKQRAFTDLTADVPEVSLSPDGCEDARLWIRWCKLSAESNSEKWVARLTERPTPPLAVIGGDTSFRALRVAEALQRHRDHWRGGPAPLFLITTATADRFVPNNIPNVVTTDEKWPKLIEVYKGRKFRFSFTNSRMAAAVLDFVHARENLWPSMTPSPDLAAACLAGPLMARDPLSAGVLAAIGDELLTNHLDTLLYTLKWDDDNFSADLADRFSVVFWKEFSRRRVSPYQIEYSVGDFYQPNPREAFVVGQILPELRAARDHRQFMLLPADPERARRFLHTVVRRAAPQDLKNLVVLTGDSLNFNTIYRDRNVAWNIQDLPVPLVMFSHRNPVAEEVGFKMAAAPGSTGTEDLLLYRDILETLLVTAYQGQQLTVSSDDLSRSLLGLVWANGRVRATGAGVEGTLLFHAADGNRADGTGEHIIVLRPDPVDRALLAQATISVWHLEAAAGGRPVWRELRTLTVTYDALQ